MASPSARYGAIKRKIRERGVIPTSEVTGLREGKGMILVISKEDMNHIIRIRKSLEISGVLGSVH